MKPKHVQFSSLMAKGNISAKDAAIAAGYSKNSASERGYELMQRPAVKKHIKKLQEQHAKISDTSAAKIRELLIEVISKSGAGEEIMVKGPDGPIGTGVWRYDSQGVNKALDTLNRMNGHYEKDNAQKASPVTLTMDF